MARYPTLYTILIQILVVVAILLSLPLMLYLFTRNYKEALGSLIGVTPAMIVSFIIFMLNYWLFVPLFYHRHKRLQFYLLNVLIYLVIIVTTILIISGSIGYYSINIFILGSSLFITLMFLVGAAALALALRNSLRNKMLREQIAEEKRRHTEDELNWLKNQINPHFLFNTLNNISALVTLDADRAQDCISRLSDLLRYAMYETSKPSVPLMKEVDFMKDYVSLMKLRCNDRTKVNSCFEIESKNARIAPLLLISLIENAFKHGVSSNLPSEISISMTEKDGSLTFECYNSNHAKDKSDHSGSGIGLKNMHRRLDLIYGEKYEWIQTSDKDTFGIIIKIEL